MTLPLELRNFKIIIVIFSNKCVHIIAQDIPFMIGSIGSRLPVSHVNIVFIPGNLFFSWISHAELHAQSTEESDRWRNIA